MSDTRNNRNHSDNDTMREEVIREDEPKYGTVVNCLKLNIRTEPSLEAGIVSEVDVLTELLIEPDKSTDEWLKVCHAGGAEGFCMAKFIALKQ